MANGSQSGVFIGFLFYFKAFTWLMGRRDIIQLTSSPATALLFMLTHQWHRLTNFSFLVPLIAIALKKS